MVKKPLDKQLKAVAHIGYGSIPYLQALKKNLLLTLKSDITRPSDVSCQITARLNVIPDVKVSLHFIKATDRILAEIKI